MNNTNTSANSFTGFSLEDSVACCILNCHAKQNKTNGFELVDLTTDCLLQQNSAIANGNDGYLYTGTSTSNNVFFGNYAQGNGGTNINVLTELAPTFTFAGGTFTAVPPRIDPVTKWDNIDAV